MTGVTVPPSFTAHQTGGALLLGGAVWLSTLTYRALAPAPTRLATEAT